MSKTIFGVPVILLFFTLALLVPLLVADYLLYKEVKHTTPVVVTPAPMSIATASATEKVATPTPTLKVIKIVPTAVVIPTAGLSK